MLKSKKKTFMQIFSPIEQPQNQINIQISNLRIKGKQTYSYCLLSNWGQIIPKNEFLKRKGKIKISDRKYITHDLRKP